MDIRSAPVINYWDAREKLVWDWPMRVGITDAAGITGAQLRKNYWAKQFTTVIPLKNNPDILFINSQEELNTLLRVNTPSFLVKIIIINLPPRSKSPATWKIAGKIAETLRKRTHASGVFLLHIDNKIADWFEEWIIRLSHNQGVVEALLGTEGEVFTTRNLNQQTRLAGFTKKILNVAKNIRFGLKQSFNVRLLTGDYRQMDVNKAVRYLSANANRLPYDFESGTASTVLNIASAIRKIEIGVPATAAVSPRNPSRFEIHKAMAKQPVKKGASNITVNPDAKHIGNNPATGNKFPKKKSAPKKAAPPTENKKKTAPQNRYLQAGFINPDGKTDVEHLQPDTTYKLQVLIAEKILQGFLKPDRIIEVDKLFEDPKQEKVKIDLLIKANTLTELLSKSITLPRTGQSTKAVFQIPTGKKVKKLELEIAAFHKNKLLQKARLIIAVSKNKTASLSKPVFKVEAALNTDFSNLDKSSVFGASIVLPAKTSSESPAIAKTSAKNWKFHYNSNMRTLISKIKQDLESLAPAAADKQLLTDPANTRVLRRLANQGSLLYTIYLNKLTFEGPVQLVNNSGDYLPLDFAYTFPAPSDPKSVLCDKAVAGLMKGACQGCAKKTADYRKIICPFGFWALSKEIERHQYKPDMQSETSSYELKTDPGKQRKNLQILQHVLHGASNRVNGRQPTLTKELAKEIGRNCKTLTTAKDWNAWKKAIPDNPDSLMLLVHIEEGDAVGVDTLEIGKDQLAQTDLDDRYIPATEKDKAPFILLIGCEANNTDTYLFDTVSNLMNNGAAIVVSNFTSIRGPQAAAILMQLVRVLRQQQGKSLRFGEVMLRLRQQLLADGRLIGLTLLAHGGIDWKINI